MGILTLLQLITLIVWLITLTRTLKGSSLEPMIIASIVFVALNLVRQWEV